MIKIGFDTQLNGSTNQNNHPFFIAEFIAPLTHSLVAFRGSGSQTITRATEATVADNSGLLVTAASGEAAFKGARRISQDVWANTDSNGDLIPAATLDGAEVWPAATNLSFPSQDDSNAGWIKNDCTVAAPSFTAPDGTATASKLVETATGNPHYINKTIVNSAGAVVTFSRYLKKGERDWAWIYIESAAVAIAYFNLNTGVKGTVSGTGTPSSTIVSVGNGWYRCTLTATVGLNSNVGVGTATADNTISHAGDITNGIYTWGSMAEAASYASSYIPTTTAAVTRNASVISVPTASNIASAAGFIALEYTPQHAPSGTVYLWGTYVDANNSTAILHDATNLIFRKRIAGVNYDATIANSFVSGTTYKMAASHGASGTSIALNGVLGTPHANTTAAQIGTTMQTGADGNGASQPGMAIKNVYIGQRELSTSDLTAMTQ